MKAVYIIGVLALLYCNKAITQADNCVVGVANGIRTDPDNAVNPDCPNQVNTFDWRQQYYPFYSAAFPTETEILSPFWNMENVHNDEIWDANVGGKDYHPSDGWELIKKGVAPEVTGYGYVVLYNRFTSILRVLFVLPEDRTSQFILTTLAFGGLNPNVPGKLTALLHPRSGLSQPMDLFSSVPVTQVSRPNSANFDLYMYADFPVEYDPCTCLQDAKLEVSFQRILTQELELYGRFLEVERDLASIQAFDQGMLNPDFLTQTYSTSDSAAGFAGSHTFATYDRLVGHYNTLRQQQAALTQRYKFFKVFNEIIGVVKPVAGSFLKAIKLDSGITISGGGDEDPDNNVNFKPTGAEVLDAVASIVNLFGAPIKSKLDATTGKVNKLGATMLSHGEMALRGSLETVQPEGRGISFRLPGQPTSCTDGLYPTYNEALGRFALLETPKVNVQKIRIQDENDENSEVIKTRLRIDPASIKYVLNSAASIAEGTELYAALRFYSDSIGIGTSAFGVDQTPLLPLECLGSFTAGIEVLLPASLDFQITKVELVLMVAYQFEGLNSENEIPRSLAVYTYPATFSVQNSVPINELWTATPDYPYELTLSSTNFTENQKIFAWGTITIEGDLTAAPGVKVEILAPNIKVLNQSFIGSDIWLHNDFVPFACEPLLPFQGSLSAFCTSNQYKANQTILNLREGDEITARAASSETDIPAELPFSVQVYPNPANNYATLHLVLPKDGEIAAFLIDPHGQAVQQVFPLRDLLAGEHLFDLDMSNLPTGIYLLSVQTNQGKHSVRVVKQ